MSAPIVRTRYGALKGTVVQNIEGGQYFAFKGIPYAEPPVGELRFKEPQPPKVWSGIRDAQNEGSPALQYEMLKPTRDIIGSEDCLYLNVATNSVSGKRAVMVWIHGGGFMLGSGTSEMYSPDYLLKHDVVVVTINYRLHVFGFLNMDDVEAAGNQGLKDQVAALKWVQENIEGFGGDPQNVTIFGESAGSASVHYLTLSPLAKGLFHKAIGQSGSLLNTWAYTKNNKESGLRLAKLLGHETTDPKEAVRFLRTVDSIALVEGVAQIIGNMGETSLHFIFVPSMDDKSENPFGPEPLLEMVKKGIDVPTIFGYNSHEGIIFYSSSVSKEEALKKIENDFSAFYDNIITNQDLKINDDIVKDVRKFYFDDEPITIAQRDNYVQILGDLHFGYGIQRIVEIQSKRSAPLYYYKFSGSGGNPYVPLETKGDIEGTCHADDLGCLFYMRDYGPKMEPHLKSYRSMQYFTKLWTNFAKTGNPTPRLDDLITKKWLPITNKEYNYLEISKELKTGINPDQEKWEFLKSISE